MSAGLFEFGRERWRAERGWLEVPDDGEEDEDGIEEEWAGGEEGEGEQEGEDEDEELEDRRFERVRRQLGQHSPLCDGPQGIGGLRTKASTHQLQCRGSKGDGSGNGRGRSRRRG